MTVITAIYCFGLGAFSVASFMTMPSRHLTSGWVIAEVLAIIIWPVYAPVVLAIYWWTE